MSVVTYLYYLSINEDNIHWAEKTYPEFKRHFRSEKRAQSYLLSRALLAFSLKKTFNIDKLPTINNQAHGKPYFSSDIPLYFNLSHSHKTIVLIVGKTQFIGVDIEGICKRKNFTGLLKRVFTPAEQEWISRQDNFERAFFYLWSAKEAYLKADGAGLSGLSRLAFDLDHKTINGPLRQGKLLITDINEESIALYLPRKNALSCFDMHQGNITKKQIRWGMILTDSNR